MITLNGTDYRLCLLDTNAVSEMAKRPELLGRFLAWSLAASPFYVPCFSLFTVLELRRNGTLYRNFVERFSPLPCVLLKSHEQLLQEEVRCYPNPTGVNPCLLGFAGLLAQENDLGTALTASFTRRSILAQERYWNSGKEHIVEGMQSFVANFPPAGDAYRPSEVRSFIQMAGFEQLVRRARDFAEGMVKSETVVDIDAFPSLKASLYTVFYKFYVDRSRTPSPSDAFDVVISAATPYVEAIFTENHQAELLRKTARLDDFIRNLLIFTLRDLRQISPAGVVSI